MCLHCHILEHEDYYMMASFLVEIQNYLKNLFYLF
ncbi:multicopper oxidase domain-containing protein [Sulfurimonas denitrificans]